MRGDAVIVVHVLIFACAFRFTFVTARVIYLSGLMSPRVRFSAPASRVYTMDTASSRTKSPSPGQVQTPALLVLPDTTGT